MGPRDGRVRACQGCQEQKVRCDIQKGSNDQCVRCSKMGLDCVKTVPTRRNRQTKATLQRELDSLKQKFQDAAATRADSVPTGTPESDKSRAPLAHSGIDFSAISSSVSMADSPQDNSASVKPLVGIPPATLPQTLDGREYSPHRINDCFVLFFRDYHPLLPLLDPDLLPNACYDHSTFLFWTILATGCRRYPEDPTMLEFLAPRVNRLAFSSLSPQTSPIYTIKGLLILCAWPTPLKSMTKDMTYVLSGSAIHLAMQLGLHVPGVGQDFAPDKLNPRPLDRVLRYRLWLLACIFCQVTSYSQGLPPTIPYNFLHLGSFEHITVSDGVRFHWELNRLHGTAMSKLMQAVFTMDSTPLVDPATQSDMLITLVRSCDEELQQLVPQVLGEMRTVFFHCTRLHIGSFYFFSRTTNEEQNLVLGSGLTDLFTTACKLINDVKMMFHSTNAGASCPAYVHRTLILAAFIILKIARSYLTDTVDVTLGEKAYFAAIVALREASLENDDLYARGAMILTQLWTSTRVFQHPDGVADSLTTRIRTRQSMSIVFDCFWWWREEFQGKPSPYNLSDDVHVPGLLPDGLSTDVASSNIRHEFFDTLAEPFPDYDWAQGIDFSAPVGLGFLS